MGRLQHGRAPGDHGSAAQDAQDPQGGDRASGASKVYHGEPVEAKDAARKGAGGDSTWYETAQLHHWGHPGEDLLLQGSNLCVLWSPSCVMSFSLSLFCCWGMSFMHTGTLIHCNTFSLTQDDMSTWIWLKPYSTFSSHRSKYSTVQYRCTEELCSFS